MVVPHAILIYRAQAKLKEGKVEESLALAREALAVTPGHIDLVSGMVTELDRPRGLPMAKAISPTSTLDESPKVAGGSLVSAGTSRPRGR